ncbi:MAG: hypothetical protein LBK82_13155 [Planctomycetaceae bacterium]|nr:hypothetical protein [Planctomycetaceae bacterium]
MPQFTVSNLIPKRLATQFAVVNLIHYRRVRRRNLSANSERSPTLTATLILRFDFVPNCFVFRF